MDLDFETLELLGHGSPWEWLSNKVFAQRVERLEVKRVAEAARRTPKRVDGTPCPACGSAFVNRRRGWLRTFCSDACRVKFHNARAPKAERPPACLACLEPLEHVPKRADGRGNRPRRFCSEKCARKHARKRAK